MNKVKETQTPNFTLTTRLYDWIAENEQQSEFHCVLDNLMQANQIAYYALLYDKKFNIGIIEYYYIKDKVQLKIIMK